MGRGLWYELVAPGGSETEVGLVWSAVDPTTLYDQPVVSRFDFFVPKLTCWEEVM